MATNANNLQIGVGVVSIGTYAAAGAASGDLVDVGHTSEPITLPFEVEVVDRTSERTLGIIATKRVGQNMSIVIPALEVTPERLRVALGLASSMLTGGTLLLGDSTTQYHQITIVQAEDMADGYTTQTTTLWRCQATTIEPLTWAQREWTIIKATFRILRDDSVGTNDKYGKIVWS